MKYVYREWNQTSEELEKIIRLNRRVHVDQFFNPNGPLRGRLGDEFPLLGKYQDDEEFFRRIWIGAADTFNSKSKEGSYIYIAYGEDDPDQNPVGFLKGGEWTIDSETFDAVSRRFDLSENVACLGSLYIAPETQGAGLGSFLTSTFAREAHTRGFDSMVTHAYAGNTSPRFFINKTGAEMAGSCRIPNGFDDDLLFKKGLDLQEMPTSIPGVILYWDKPAFQKLVRQ